MTYWNHTGKYQALGDELEKLIPIRGECEDKKLEFLRVVSNSYYDCYNNGACNPHRFEEVVNQLPLWSTRIKEHLNEQEWQDIQEFLAYASTEHRDFYALNFSEQNDVWHSKSLHAMERLKDAAVLIAAVKLL